MNRIEKYIVKYKKISPDEQCKYCNKNKASHVEYEIFYPAGFEVERKCRPCFERSRKETTHSQWIPLEEETHG